MQLGLRNTERISNWYPDSSTWSLYSSKFRYKNPILYSWDATG